MKKIKISEQQDKEIRNIIKENLEEVLDPNGGSLSLHYNTPGNTTPNTAGQIGNTAVAAAKAAKNVSGNPNINNAVSFTADPDNDKKPQTITVSGNSKLESVIISKKQLDEIRLRKLKENSKLVTIENFLR